MKKLFEERLTGEIGQGYKGKYTIKIHEFNLGRREKEYEIICNTKEEVIEELVNLNPGQCTNIDVILDNGKTVTAWYGQGDTGKAVTI